MEELKIVYLSPDALTPYERNAKIHPDAQVEHIANSIREFGFRQPLVVDKDGVVVIGHGRLMAAKKLGLESVPVTYADDLTDEQIKALRLADNKTNESPWDFSALEEELAELDEMFEMADFGFGDEPDGEESDVSDVQEDDFDEENVPEEPRTKLGDIYILGRHRLMCGDSTDAETVVRLMDGEKADMVFTDPPYNIASESKNYAADCSKSMKNLEGAEWDKDFQISPALESVLFVLADNSSVYICTSHFLTGEIWDWMKEWSDHYSYCIWSNPNPMPSLAKRHWTWNTEIICYATRGKHTFNFPEEGHALSTWTINKKNGQTGHPTEKPVEVPSMAVSHSSKRGDLVLDLFGGSGSTLIACEQLDRVCYTMELDPHYCDVIVDRWEKFTGEKAVLLNE